MPAALSPAMPGGPVWDIKTGGWLPSGWVQASGDPWSLGPPPPDTGGGYAAPSTAGGSGALGGYDTGAGGGGPGSNLPGLPNFGGSRG